CTAKWKRIGAIRLPFRQNPLNSYGNRVSIVKIRDHISRHLGMAGVQQSVLDEFRVKRKASEPGSKSRRVDKVRLQLSHVHVDFRNSPAKLVQLAANVNDKDSVGARC